MADDKAKSWIDEQNQLRKEHDEEFSKWRPRLEAELTEEQRKSYEARKANNAQVLSDLRSDIKFEEKTRKQDILEEKHPNPVRRFLSPKGIKDQFQARKDAKETVRYIREDDVHNTIRQVRDDLDNYLKFAEWERAGRPDVIDWDKKMKERYSRPQTPDKDKDLSRARSLAEAHNRRVEETRQGPDHEKDDDRER